MAEEFRPVPGWVGVYEVSAIGQVRSIRTGRVLKHTVSGDGYHRVNLKADGRRESRTVHRVVAESFIGERPAGHHIRHLDGDKDNNRLGNLAYGTASENVADTKRLGRNAHLNKDSCPRGHRYESWNLIERRDVGRACRACSRAASEAWRLRQRGQEADKGLLADMYYRRLQLGYGEKNKHYGGEHDS